MVGQIMSNKGSNLWQKAKTVIPGGNMLLSKRAEMFLPEQWPAYFSKTSGNQVWDLDGRQYTDMLFAVGANTLGYNHKEIDDAVISSISSGNLSSLNAPEEVYLAEELIEIHPWADMARFARTGGEANALAIRIARAASGKDTVAICGYHGWHDWYLSANLGNEESLAGHLLPGLDPAGVPKKLAGSVVPFQYNDYEELFHLVNEKNIGVIMMEVSRNFGPEDNFLQKVRCLANEKNIVLIFDECTSGFRETFGGLHKKYGVDPDMAIFGKAIGNGYALTATIGRKEVMEAAQNTFISSTFWTERSGSVAALKTLEIMKREKSWEIITEIGKNIKDNWQRIADLHNVKLTISGLDALASFSFAGKNAPIYKTYLTQEMLKAGFLASNIIYTSIAHQSCEIDKYYATLDEIFKTISNPKNHDNALNLLDGPICHTGFKRLN